MLLKSKMRQYANPAKAHGQCHVASSKYCYFEGSAKFFQMGSYRGPYLNPPDQPENSWGPSAITGPLWYHCVAVQHDFVIDWTFRQFDPKSVFPLIYPLDMARREWEEVDELPWEDVRNILVANTKCRPV